MKNKRFNKGSMEAHFCQNPFSHYETLSQNIITLYIIIILFLSQNNDFVFKYNDLFILKYYIVF